MAQIFARVFPAQRTFVKDLRDLFDFPASDFTFGPFPNDRLILQTDRIVEYETPPHAEGLGTTNTRLKAGDGPIDGIAIRNTISHTRLFRSYLSGSAATPGNSIPARNSNEAPPPVEMCEILSDTPAD
jgi:hypothetical protein